MHRTLYALTHVASQIVYKWLPPPIIGGGSPVLCDPDAPESVMELVASGEAPFVTWFQTYAARSGDLDGRRLARATKSFLARCRSEGALWICPIDEAFPPLLRQIADPPPGLTLFGDPALLQQPLVAIVGSRKASPHAVRQAFELGRLLADARVTVVSGGALGCDVAAHLGVLSSGVLPAQACCVFAGGLDALYPVANDPVFRRLRHADGVLLTERLWGASCRRLDFHGRNRLISGMAGTTVVMQAGERSGAKLTARLVLDQGRDLAVLLHPEGDVRADGSRALIADGARGFADAQAVAAALVPAENPLKS